MVQNRALPAAARRAQILDQIERTGGITIGEVVRVHAVSPLTVHRDLEQLARDGLIERVRGGAHAVERPRRRTVHSTAWEHRIAQAPEAKAAIARHAIKLIPESATVFLDASSTALALAVTLMDRPPHKLTVVTNSPMIAANGCAEPIHVVVCPGELDHQMRAMTGQWTVEFIGRLRFDMAFISGAGITLDAGLTTSRGPISDVLNAARAAAVEHNGARGLHEVRAGIAGVDRPGARVRVRGDGRRPGRRGSGRVSRGRGAAHRRAARGRVGHAANSRLSRPPGGSVAVDS